jgi:putative copper export protein
MVFWVGALVMVIGYMFKKKPQSSNTDLAEAAT